MIGLGGAHRVGKSTLAKTFAHSAGFYYLETNVSDTFKRLGFDVKADYNFEDRLLIQQEILLDIERTYMNAPTPYFIADRTPLDVYSYTLADVQRGTLDEELEELLESHWRSAVRITNENLRLFIQVQPGIPLKENPKSAPLSKGYMEHFNAIMTGLVMGRAADELLTNMLILKREVISLDERVSILFSFAKRQFPEYMFLQDNTSRM